MPQGRRQGWQALSLLLLLLPLLLLISGHCCGLQRVASPGLGARSGSASGSGAALEPAAETRLGLGPGSGPLEVGSTTCPAWLVQYEQFHAEHRGRPGAKYLVHRVEKENGGLGDRLRGMMFAARLAVATSRVLLFAWSQPHDVSAFLAPPRAIDWRVEGTAYDPSSLHPHFFWLYDNRPQGPDWHEYFSPGTVRGIGRRRFILSGGLNRLRDTWITISTNEVMDSPCSGCPPLDPWGADAMCLWHYLFEFLPFIREAAEQQRQLLFPGAQAAPVWHHGHSQQQQQQQQQQSVADAGQVTERAAGAAGTAAEAGAATPPYVAVHLRLGGFAGEPEAQHRGRGGGGGHIQDLASSLRCARHAAYAAGLNITTASPLLLITDNDALRRFVTEGQLLNVVTPTLTPVHLERAVGLPKEAHLPTFIELLLLAGARCLVMSRSGFSHQAYLYSRRVGSTSCSMQLEDCPEL